MKKVSVIMLTVVLLVVLSACGGNKSSGSIDYPDKAINLIVPFSAGGGTDLVARTIAEEAKKILGKEIIVVNKTGAAGVIGATEAANAKADGYTIMIGTTGLFTTIPLLGDTQYSIDDFIGIVGLTKNASYLIVNADSTYQTIDDLLNEKSTDKVVKFGDNGVGSIPHLTQAYFYKQAGIKSQEVPFKGTAPTIVALLGDQIDTVSANTAGFSTHEKAGTVRVLATFVDERTSAFPDVPTMKEKGIDMNMGVTNFILAPEGTPDEIVQILRDAFIKAKESESFQALVAKIQSEESPLKGEDIVETMKKETASYKDVIDTLGINKQ